MFEPKYFNPNAPNAPNLPPTALLRSAASPAPSAPPPRRAAARLNPRLPRPIVDVHAHPPLHVSAVEESVDGRSFVFGFGAVAPAGEQG